MTNGIAVVGKACCYPDARSPNELWENVQAQRRAFRRMPDERLRLADFLSRDRESLDCLYSTNVAVISDYEFDRLRFRVAGSTFRSADMAHWLALDVADQTLEDAGFAAAEGLPRETTGVFLGNTLTGEFSRANALRLRWPYVRRTIENNLVNEGWSLARRSDFLKKVESTYKDPFPPIGDESLAGGLSNTIAGRICNYFDFKGGGYTIDGACASSLLAIANACSALMSGDLDAALAGGVDLSLDPFELVGFARVGALAADEMRIYDSRSNGFWPGEGCGFVLLMRYEDAIAQRLQVCATVKGWGISSDGNGGITRPEVDGQLLALKRAYARAGFGIETVAYFEGHGTGTMVGDSVELKALSLARGQSKTPAAISSIKANIGHTKAAAGVAGFIKAVMALNAGIIPPTTACEEPHPELKSESPALRTLKMAEPWPEHQALRAGVSSMGFGGINAHVVLESAHPEARHSLSHKEHSLISSFQDAELFLFGAQSVADLQRHVSHLSRFAGSLSRAELSDVAAQLEASISNQDVRAALVASKPDEFAECLKELSALINTETSELNTQKGIFWRPGQIGSRIGFLFPGQGSPIHLNGGALGRRFDFIQEIYAQAQLEKHELEHSTLTAQPAIVTGSIATLRLLKALNINAEIAVGHSLGELTAFQWAGAIDEETILRIARSRAMAMNEWGTSSGAMASIMARAEEVSDLLREGVSIAGFNSPTQTVISGDTKAVSEVLERAREKQLTTIKLPVSHAFHSTHMAAAAPVLAALLAREKFGSLQRTLVSTITGKRVPPDADLPELLTRQLTLPVRFLEAVTEADSAGVDLWLEVGPGRVLTAIMGEISNTPVVSLDAGGESLRGLLCATGAAFVFGQPVNHRALFEGRFTKPFDLDWTPKFFVSPCERVPVVEVPQASYSLNEAEQIKNETGQSLKPNPTSDSRNGSVLDLVTELVAQRAELPISAIRPESRLLSDLHLNSITVSQLVAESAHRLHLPRSVSPTDFADATIGEVTQALAEQLILGVSPGSEIDLLPAGVDSWVRAFRVELVERALRQTAPSRQARGWTFIAPLENSFADALHRKFAAAAGNGVVVCFPHEADEALAGDLLKAARLVIDRREGTTLVLVQPRPGASAFARTLHLEAPYVTTCIVNLSRMDQQAADWVLAEAMAAEGYTESHYDERGHRFEPVLRPLPLFEESSALPLSVADVMIVTGGGKGITAECALALARETGVRLALVGLSRPESNSELSTNLKRMTAAGVVYRYFSADVTDAAQVRSVIQTVEKEMGPVTGFLHGAAVNTPRLISALDEELIQQSLAVKVQGALNILAGIDPEKLRLFVSFSSIIARSGLRGEAHYGMANECLSDLTEQWKAKHPSCKCLALEWSLWSDVGMGQRLARTDLLAQHGITPIPPDKGVSILRQLLAQPLLNGPVLVTGRFAEMPTLKLDRPDLPLLRFLEQPRSYFPNVELIVDVDLATTTDPYLNDHRFNGERLLPAVMGFEAMAQVAIALTGLTQLPTIEDVAFSLPIVVPETDSRRIRIAALQTSEGIVKVAVRSEETAFQMDHFVGTCKFEKPCLSIVKLKRHPRLDGDSPIALQPGRDLYGKVLFHQGRFQRLSNYRVLTANECLAEISHDGKTTWFGPYLPKDLVLGDPGMHDAALHAIQACIPAATLLPTGIERLSLRTSKITGPVFVQARERSNEENNFIYDVSVTDMDGGVLESWDGLQLTAIEARPINQAWVEPLLAPYLERCFRDLFSRSDVSVALVRDEDTDHQARSAKAIRMLLGEESEILRRPDGKPEVAGERSVSTSHHGDLTLAVAGMGQVSCDIEPVVARAPSLWQGLLGKERLRLAQFIDGSAYENRLNGATRVWAAGECLKKAGALIAAPLTFLRSQPDGWILLSSGQLKIATYAAQIQNEPEKIIIAILTEIP